MNTPQIINRKSSIINPPGGDLHVEVLNRSRVLSNLRTVARLLRLGLEELESARQLAQREIGDEHLNSQILHFQNQLTLAELDQPDLGAMEQGIEQLRLQAFCPPPSSIPHPPSAEVVTSVFGSLARTSEHGANIRQPAVASV